MGGKQAKAIVNTLKQPNASRFFKGYAQKMAKNQEENRDYYKSLYGESFAMQENDKSKGNINTTVKKATKKPARPSSAFPARGMKRNPSSKSIKETERSRSRKASTRTLAKVYGE